MTVHSRFMQIALALARRNLGQTWPNPSVGAIIVRDGQIIAPGITGRGGRPHAETQALAQAGANARGATLYVTLEPCPHHGQTPPCTEAIVAAGIATVVIACRDPHPQVNGHGIAQLQKAGIEVIENICKAESLEINQGFFSVIQKQRPFTSLKLASSLDGRIAFPPGSKKQWITGERARNYGHLLRSRYDAIATGIGTVLADDPLLTCRLPGLEDRSPVRVVFDRQGRLPKHSALATTAGKIPLWIIGSSRRGLPLPKSAQLIGMDPGLRRDDEIRTAVQLLAEKGITRLLVEAGAALSTSFLRSGLVDRIYWFRAPIVIGEEGFGAIKGDFTGSWRLVERIGLPPDTLDILECSPAS